MSISRNSCMQLTSYVDSFGNSHSSERVRLLLLLRYSHHCIAISASCLQKKRLAQARAKRKHRWVHYDLNRPSCNYYHPSSESDCRTNSKESPGRHTWNFELYPFGLVVLLGHQKGLAAQGEALRKFPLDRGQRRRVSNETAPKQ